MSIISDNHYFLENSGESLTQSEYSINIQSDLSSFRAILYKNLRILEINSDFIIGALGYKLFKIINGEKILILRIDDKKYSLFSKFRFTRRLFRAEVHTYKTLKNNLAICTAKKGIFLENKITGKFDKVFNIIRGSRPMTLCEDREGNIFFGEYFINKNGDKVNIYASFNGGLNWQVVYTFLAKLISHIHGIHLDPYTGFLWVTTGDENGECIIAYTKDKFKNLEIVAHGGQEYRTCKLLFLEDKILFGTDSPYVENYIKVISRSDLSIQLIQKVQGSVINACQIGNKCIISTTVEPSKINRDKNSYIWISENGDQWYQVAQFKKDCFNGMLFQFGNIRFPHYNNTNCDSLFFSGHALKFIDGHTIELQNLNDYLKFKA